MKIIRQRANQIMHDIRQVLLAHWDPFGVKGAGPDDEYDSYIVHFYRLLLKRPTEDELIDLLFSLEMGQAEFSMEDRERLSLVAGKLLEINVSLSE